MSKDNPKGLIPVKEEWLEWCLQNPIMMNDDEFVQVMFEQFSGAAIQLERLSNDLKVAIGSECFDSWISNVILSQIKRENPVLRKWFQSPITLRQNTCDRFKL